MHGSEENVQRDEAKVPDVVPAVEEISSAPQRVVRNDWNRSEQSESADYQKQQPPP